MRLLRGLARTMGLVTWLALLIPLPALVALAFFELAADGAVRLTVFPLALVVFDPFLAECVRNSVVAATIVSAGALILGTVLGWILERRRFWGRAPVTCFLFGLVVVPPMFGAIGLSVLVQAVLDTSRVQVHGEWSRWLIWVWVELAAATPLVAVAVSGGLRRVDRVLEDAGRLVGASRWGIARELVWPLIRPGTAAAVGLVFTAALVEPGAPLTLNLRRTLAFQIVDSATTPAGLGRAGVLALEAIAIAAVVRVLLRWWGGASSRLELRPSGANSSVVRGRTAILLNLAIWPLLILAWFPIGTLLAFDLPVPGILISPAGPVRSPDPERGTVSILTISVIVGAVATGIAWMATRPLTVSGTSYAPLLARLARWSERVPPLALGVGVVAIPHLLRVVAGVVPEGRMPGPVAWLEGMAEVLAPAHAPIVLLTMAIAATLQPIVSRGLERARQRPSEVLVQAAINLGASDRRARRTPMTGHLLETLGIIALAIALGATNLAPAMLVGVTREVRIVSPEVLIQAERAEAVPRGAAPLARMVVLLNCGAFAIAARFRHGPLHAWLRSRPG